MAPRLRMDNLCFVYTFQLWLMFNNARNRILFKIHHPIFAFLLPKHLLSSRLKLSQSTLHFSITFANICEDLPMDSIFVFVVVQPVSQGDIFHLN
ncbi:hypothetical protein ACTXT7_007398 [Hymenolepis weldensis]